MEVSKSEVTMEYFSISIGISISKFVVSRDCRLEIVVPFIIDIFFCLCPHFLVIIFQHISRCFPQGVIQFVAVFEGSFRRLFSYEYHSHICRNVLELTKINRAL